MSKNPDDVTETLPAMNDEAVAGGETAFLVVLSGSRVGTMVAATDGLMIGRSPDAGLVVADEGVSRQHVRITTTDSGELVAEDLGSRNGMLINGIQAKAKVLKDGDKIRIGMTTILKFSHTDRIEQSFQKQMLDAAIFDQLTRLHNRRSLDDHLPREFVFAQRHGAPLSLVMFDIDHFKEVNDRHGHVVGDAVLAGIAVALGRGIRQEDLLARYGGEEFVLVCRQTPGPIAFGIAHRLRCAVKSGPLVPQRPNLLVTLSAGVCAVPDPRIARLEQLIEGADQALYQAKAGGRDRICLRAESGERWLFDED